MDFSSGYAELLEPENRKMCVRDLKGTPSLVRPMAARGSSASSKTGRASAVLIPVCKLPDGAVGLLYTKRNPFLRAHPRQVCFPGGRCDLAESVEETAVREAHEELGLPPERVDVWAAMRPVADRLGESGVHPVVGEVRGQFSLDQLTLNRDEVESAFVIPLAELNDPGVKGYTQFRPYKGGDAGGKYANGYTLPVFQTRPYPVWGLTAIITFQFLSVFLRRSRSGGYRHPINFRTPLRG